MGVTVHRGIPGRALLAAGWLAWAIGSVPGGPPAPPDAATRGAGTQATTFSVATYNIFWGNTTLPAAAEAIRKSGADVVLLQETTRQSEQYLRRALMQVYPAATFQEWRGAGGFGLMSRWPIVNRRFLPPQGGPFGTLMAQTKLGGRMVTIVNVHLQPSVPAREGGLGEALGMFLRTEPVRAKEIEGIWRAVPSNQPVIIAGDFNSLPGLPATGFLIARGLVDSQGSVAPPEGRPADTWHRQWRGVECRYRLDYIFHSRDFKTLSSRVIPAEGSDHSLLTGVLAWRERKDAPLGSSPASAPSRGTMGPDD